MACVRVVVVVVVRDMVTVTFCTTIISCGLSSPPTFDANR